MSTTPSLDDNIALIGGIVGGAVALLLVGALVAFCVARRRRNSHRQGQHAVQTPSNSSNYGRVDNSAAASSNYGDVKLGPKEDDTYGNGNLDT